MSDDTVQSLKWESHLLLRKEGKKDIKVYVVVRHQGLH